MINKIRKFMYGRYGIDELYSFLFKVYIFIFILNIFLKLEFISYIELFLVLFIFYRVFSKNIYKRSNENVKYLKLKKEFINFFKKNKTIKYDKDHIYRKCRKCHKILKLPLPYERGIKTIKCPKCGTRKKTLILKKQKIEVIKKKKK